jgi:hypothetical protein
MVVPSIGDCPPFRDFCLQCSILHQFLSYFNIIVFYRFYYHILSEMKQIRWEMVDTGDHVLCVTAAKITTQRHLPAGLATIYPTISQDASR